MAITPTGKTRVMVAQNFGNPLSEGYALKSIKDNPTFGKGEALNEGGYADKKNNFSNMGEGFMGEENSDRNSSKRKTLSNYIFTKLESWGYPGRRLQEFKSKFVKETVSVDGIKDVQIEIPDKKYPNESGATDTVENSDLKDISEEIKKMFELNFNGAERSDGKWTIKFTSQPIAKAIDEEEEESFDDNLDEIYGNSQTKKKKNKLSFTTQELINESKASLISQLKKR